MPVIGFTNGCFDLLHDGHKQLIADAQERCDELIVAINSDDSVHRLKGKGRPVQPWRMRAGAVASLLRDNDADRVYRFDTEEELCKLINQFKPDVVFKGAEYQESDGLREDYMNVCGKRLVFLRMLPGYSTTSEIAKRT